MGSMCERWLLQRNIVHRDLKLGNMLMQKSSRRITLTNFCLGCHLLSDKHRLRDQRGSPAYISPEVLIGGTSFNSFTSLLPFFSFLNILCCKITIHDTIKKCRILPVFRRTVPGQAVGHVGAWCGSVHNASRPVPILRQQPTRALQENQNRTIHLPAVTAPISVTCCALWNYVIVSWLCGLQG